MPRGGVRPGAGRKPGTKNRPDAKMIEEEAIAKAKAAGKLPHELLFDWAHDESKPEHVRLAAMSAAAPYYAPKKSEITERRPEPSDEEIETGLRAGLKKLLLTRPELIEELRREIAQEKPSSPPALAVVA